MSVTSIHLAKVLYSFTPNAPGQLPIDSGSYVLLPNRTSPEWTNARDIVTGEEGFVPTSYLKEMTFKLRKGEQMMFLAIADFSTGVEGDLDFKPGELIIGERKVNEEWWEGRLALQPATSQIKMFPLTFVVEVNPDGNNQSSILEKFDEYISTQAPPFIGKVVADFEARYEDELSLRAGQEIEVLRDSDQNWYYGRCVDNRSGIFPKSFVDFVRAIPSQDKSFDPKETDIPLYRTQRALHSEYFEANSSSPDSKSSHPEPKQQVPREIYQNVSTFAQPQFHSHGLPPVVENQATSFSPPANIYQGAQPMPSPSTQTVNAAAYINFDEIFKEVQQNSSKPSSLISPTTSASNTVSGSTYKAAVLGPVFDSKTLSQLNSSFSLDDIVRYEMTRAVETVNTTTPPSRPPPPSSNPRAPISSISTARNGNGAPTLGAYSQAPLIPIPATSQPSVNQQSMGATARPRPQPSLSPTPIQFPLPPTRQTRSQSVNFNEIDNNGNRYNTSPIQQSSAQLLPAFKPDRPPPVVIHRQQPVIPQNGSNGALDKRTKVIEELVQTEQSYFSDMELCVRVITNTPVPAVGAGFACQITQGMSHPLLGNMQEVVDVSQKLLDSLKWELSKTKENQLIGSCFIKIASELENVYSRYCQHQPGAAAFLNRLNQVDATKSWVQKVTEIMKQERSSAFSLESILLKPVQRILKYPLLLAELIRNTPPEYADTEALVSASGSLSKLTSRLNETRRRLDLVLKYRRSPSFTSRLSRAINVHTIRKKTGRFSQRISDTITFSSANATDEEFIRREQEYQSADRLLRQMVRLLQRWTEAYSEFCAAQRELVGAINDFTGGDASCQPFASFREQWSRSFDTAIISTRVGKVNALSVDPLRQLVDMFGGPNNVIKKRQDKLLDFRRLSGHQDPSSTANENSELTMARTDFVAINCQLNEELPSLCRFSYRIVLLALVSFFRHYSQMSRSTAAALNPPASSVGAAANLASSLSKMSLNFSFIKSDSTLKSPASASRLSDTLTPVQAPRLSITSIPPVPSFSSATPPIIDSNSTNILRSKYSVSDLYTTIEPTVSKQLMELALPSGAIVGIVKRHDPNGGQDRWFVDTGVVKGFVPRRSLRPFTPSPSVDAMLLNLMD